MTDCDYSMTDCDYSMTDCDNEGGTLLKKQRRRPVDKGCQKELCTKRDKAVQTYEQSIRDTTHGNV
jgi:hypothetical protein